MIAFRSTFTIISAVLLLQLLSVFAAPSEIIPDGSNDETLSSYADSTSQTPTFKCSYGEPEMDAYCSKKASIWKGTPKHDCCWQLLKFECFQDQLELVCEHSQYQTLYQKYKQDIDFLWNTNLCLKDADRNHCKPAVSELHSEPIAGWMLTVAGIIVFLLLLCAIALGIKFC